MPQHQPLPPPLLLVSSVLAAQPAAWLALAAEAVVAGAVGALAGIPWGGLSFTHGFIVRPVQASGAQLPAVVWTVVLLAGPVGTAAIGLAAHFLAEATRAAAWLRVPALEWGSFALLRLPALVFAGVAPGGRGPVNELYSRLGEPQGGRWSLAPLAALALGGVATIVVRRSIATGREWMRLDGREFRRRLVRVLGGYPSLVSLVVWCVLAPWAAPVWMAAWLLLTLASMHVLVS
jgi:hypothetical protein